MSVVIGEKIALLDLSSKTCLGRVQNIECHKCFYIYIWMHFLYGTSFFSSGYKTVCKPFVLIIISFHTNSESKLFVFSAKL
jgi:hypothetical protein